MPNLNIDTIDLTQLAQDAWWICEALKESPVMLPKMLEAYRATWHRIVGPNGVTESRDWRGRARQRAMTTVKVSADRMLAAIEAGGNPCEDDVLAVRNAAQVLLNESKPIV